MALSSRFLAGSAWSNAQVQGRTKTCGCCFSASFGTESSYEKVDTHWLGRWVQSLKCRPKERFACQFRRCLPMVGRDAWLARDPGCEGYAPARLRTLDAVAVPGVHGSTRDCGSGHKVGASANLVW